MVLCSVFLRAFALHQVSWGPGSISRVTGDRWHYWWLSTGMGPGPLVTAYCGASSIFPILHVASVWQVDTSACFYSMACWSTSGSLRAAFPFGTSFHQYAPAFSFRHQHNSLVHLGDALSPTRASMHTLSLSPSSLEMTVVVVISGPSGVI